MASRSDYPTETDQHRQLRDTVWERMNGWRRFLIALDGVDAAGKSNLARYLAWQLGMPAIESDLYLVRDAGRLEYHQREMLRVLNHRLDLNRPVVFEGIRARKLLVEMQLSADFTVWVEQDGWAGGYSLEQDVSAYVAEFQPRESADFIFRRPADF